jgi:pyruvate dehydrogenase E1 component alpha subunit
MVPKEVLLKMFYYLRLTREAEYRIERVLYRQGKIVGGVYVGRGQEAIGVGSAIHLRPDDVVAPSHRDMSVFLIRGIPLRHIMAQYMGRKGGVTGGKDGNMHMGDMRRHIIAFPSHMADTVPVAAGCALAFKLRGEERVAVCYFGDGATSRADWHEGLNFAAVHRLPIVYICNNNQYAYSTPLWRQMAVPNVADRAINYGIPGEIVDGNDVLAVYEATARAVERARRGEGPTLLECKTFRMTGHAAHDDAFYVPKELFEEWAAKDPIARLAGYLTTRGIATEAELREVEARVVREVDEAIAWAEQSPYPDPEECLEGVYAPPTS